MRSLVPLEVIANDIVADLGDSVGRHRMTITRHLLDCYREFSTFVEDSFDVKTQVLKADNAINMPCDFVFETKVGVMRHGKLAVLMLDKKLGYKKLNDTATTDYLDEIWNGFYEGDGYYFYNAYREDMYLGELYGMGRPIYNAGTYNIDRKNGVIYVGSHIPKDAEIVIEYKSDGLSDGLKMVPSEAKKMMEYYAKAEWYADKNITQSQINRNLYKQQRFKVRKLYNFRTALYMAAKVNETFSPTNY